LISTSKNKTQAAEGVVHLAMSTQFNDRLQAFADIIKVYGKGGKTIVFTETKHDANEVALSSSISSICQVLHGDIAQQQREISLASFREGRFQVLVATDVAARGLDIEGVDLIIQSSPPKDYEHYIHRSGRTGRAGRQGTSVTLFTPRTAKNLQDIERHGKLKFLRVGVPQPKDLYLMSGSTAVKDVIAVDLDVIPNFLPFAREILEHHEGNAEHAIAAALATITGYTKKADTRSLLANTPGYITLLVKPKDSPILSVTYALQLLKAELSPAEAAKIVIKTVKITTDGGAVADVPEAYFRKIVDTNELRGPKRRVTISIISELPPIKEDSYSASQRNGFGRGGGNGFHGRGGGGRQRGRFNNRGGGRRF